MTKVSEIARLISKSALSESEKIVAEHFSDDFFNHTHDCISLSICNNELLEHFNKSGYLAYGYDTLNVKSSGMIVVDTKDIGGLIESIENLNVDAQVICCSASGKTSRKEILSEGSRAKKLAAALKGSSKHIKTIAIMSPENPMGRATSKEENDKLYDGFKKTLKLGHVHYMEIKGMYGQKERSFMIMNMPFENIKEWAKNYNQESFIFINVNDDKIHSEYWQKPDKGDYEKLTEADGYIDAENATDFFSTLTRKFKFTIPFVFDSYNVKNENEFQRLLSESLDMSFSGRHRFICRCKMG